MVSHIMKPLEWNDLPLYKKIQIYGKSLTEEHTMYVDKLKAKQIVKDILGDRVEVARIVRVLNDYTDFKVEDLNPCHIIKSAHASGWNINISPTTTYDQVLNSLRLWNQPYHQYDEVQYKYIAPTFFIEEKIEDSVLGNCGGCLTYMFRFIHGHLISIGVGFNTQKGIHLCNHYDDTWKLILEPEINFDIPRPSRLDEMIEMSTILANAFEFVRVDLF